MGGAADALFMIVFLSFLSFCLSLLMVALCSPELGQEVHRLLVLTLAWSYIERSRDKIITAGDILINDSGHLLYRCTQKPLQGQPDTALGQISIITTFTPGLNCPPPVV